MTQTYTITSNVDLINELEHTQYELNAHKDLIQWFFENKLDLQNPNLITYMQEYKEIFMTYDQLKQKVEDLCIRPLVEDKKMISWHLDFDSKAVTVTYE